MRNWGRLDMKSEWRNCTLGDCLKIIKTSVIPQEGITYSCFSLPAFDNFQTPEVLDGKDIKSSKFVLTENTILFNKLNPNFRRIWNIHSLNQIRNPISSTEFLPLKVNEDVCQDFLYYYICSPSFTALMNGIKTGTSNSQQRIDWRLFLRQPICLPALPIQHSIAQILKAIDEKIAINRAINENLERQAQAIYHERFETVSPDALPSDWRIVTLGEVATISNKSFNPLKNPEIMLEHYSIPAFDEARFPVFELSTSIKSNKFLIDDSCFMISKLNPTTKRVWKPYCLTGNAVCSTEFIVYKARDKSITDFLYSVIDSGSFSDFMCSHVTGSTGSRQRTTPSDTLSYEFILPSEDELAEFQSLVSPMYAQIRINAIENDKLKRLRDSLLPKLITGEIDVSAVQL